MSSVQDMADEFTNVRVYWFDEQVLKSKDFNDAQAARDHMHSLDVPARAYEINGRVRIETPGS